MSKQIEAMKRWVEVFDGNWHDEPVDTEWADRAHQALAEMRQAIAEAEQPAQQDSPWCMKMNGCKTKCEDCPDEAPKQPAQTEAERMADYLDGDWPGNDVSAELRRLVSFNNDLMDEVARLNKAFADERERAQRENAYVALEREACAKVAENGLIGHTIAKAIRARGNT